MKKLGVVGRGCWRAENERAKRVRVTVKVYREEEDKLVKEEGKEVEEGGVERNRTTQPEAVEAWKERELGQLSFLECMRQEEETYFDKEKEGEPEGRERRGGSG